MGTSVSDLSRKTSRGYFSAQNAFGDFLRTLPFRAIEGELEFRIRDVKLPKAFFDSPYEPKSVEGVEDYLKQCEELGIIPAGLIWTIEPNKRYFTPRFDRKDEKIFREEGYSHEANFPGGHVGQINERKRALLERGGRFHRWSFEILSREAFDLFLDKELSRLNSLGYLLHNGHLGYGQDMLGRFGIKFSPDGKGQVELYYEKEFEDTQHAKDVSSWYKRMAAKHKLSKSFPQD